MNFLQAFFQRIFSSTTKEPDPMKYLIVGLGNIGPEYTNTRHNVGFLVIDALAKEFEVTLKADNLGDVGEFKHKGRTFVLLKPSTYMNLSGKAVRYWMQKKKVEKSNVLVILDDLNLPFGKQRLRAKGKDGGHNGLKNIDQVTGGNNYARLRIGIGNDYNKGKQINYVLGEWDAEEENVLPELLRYAADTAKSFGTIGIDYTMNQFNKR